MDHDVLSGPIPHQHGVRRRLAALPFRVRLTLTSQALVLLTIALMLVPLYVGSRAQILNVYRERLTAAALGASVAIPADTVTALAASTARVSVPYLTVRDALRDFGRAIECDSTRGAVDRGVGLVREVGSQYQMLAHSAWPVMRPERLDTWRAPRALADSLSNLRAGHTHIYWFGDGASLTAVAPVLTTNSIPVGLVVARAPTSDALAEVRQQLIHLAWLPLLALLLAGIVASWLSGQLTHRVERLARDAQVIAAGRLRHELSDEWGDELGVLATALRDLRDHLRELLADIGGGAREVSDTVQTLTNGSEEMRVSTTEVSTAARSIAAATHRQTEGISAIVAMAADAARQAEAVTAFATRTGAAVQSIVTAARQGAEEGTAALNRMLSITAVTAEAVPAVVELSDKSKQINTILASVTRLANQSNLLAVNTAIEAARAGEQGRGFVVIADEIRALANATAAALEAVRALATEVCDVADLTTTRMGEMQRSVNGGEAAIRASAQSLQRIVAEAETGQSAVDEITALARQQHDRAAAVSEYVHAVAHSATENAATAQQVSVVVEAQAEMAAGVATTSHRLAAVATQLRGALVRFEV